MKNLLLEILSLTQGRGEIDDKIISKIGEAAKMKFCKIRGGVGGGGKLQ